METIEIVIYMFLTLLLLFLIGTTIWWNVVGEGESVQRAGTCAINLAELPSVDTFERCNDINGIPQNLWYSFEYDRTLSATPTMWEKACSQWCDQLTLPYTCEDGGEEYTRCVNEIKPTSCSAPALPVARNGPNPIYVYRKGKINCY